jgi:hypothetical protein
MKIEITGVEPNEPKIDYAKAGQIMVSKHSNNIVITSGKTFQDVFSGTSINEYVTSDKWEKSAFTPLPTTQKLILSNE